MKQFAKNILVLGVTSALSLSFFNLSHAATYEVVEVDKDATGYTYGGKLNLKGEMAVSETNSYNFPVQFEYFNEADFNSIVNLALTRHDYYFGIEPIEDLDAMKAGDPTANDLTWAKLYLQEKNKSSADFEYQVVADIAAMINLDASDQGVPSTERCIFDTDFNTGSSPCNGTLTRSTVSVIEGISDSGFIFGTASAPYLPIEGPALEADGTFKKHWLREHGDRGFYSDVSGEIISVDPIEMRYGGGISAIFDMNENGIAVGYSSYALGKNRENYINNVSGGCADPAVLAAIPKEICIQKIQSGMYHIQAFKAVISASAPPETEFLGLLVEPHDDDERAFASQAVAINNNGVAVGYAHGWNNSDVTTPTSTERMNGSYAVMFKDGKVFDFNQKHYYLSNSVFLFSKAHDINDNGLVVGYTTDVNTLVKKFFYVDTSVPESEMEIIIPKDFFTTSVSTAFSVNSTGVIVGEAQIESHNDSFDNPRRTAGFLFDTSSDSPVIIDVNTLLTCNSDYNIIKAVDINDVGQISATAIVKSASYDALGKPIVDESGAPVVIDVARAVLLKPIAGGVIDDCGLVEEKVERQGGSISAIMLFSLLSLFGLRRRRLKQ
jgi:hypothetical protein